MFKNEIIVSGLSAILLGVAVVMYVPMFSIGGLVYAQESENATTSEPRVNSIQTAQSGSLSQINDTAYTLELNDVSDKTILFSDRPDRIVTPVNTSDFVGGWSSMADSFAIDPPNIALVVDTVDASQQETALVELFNPVYDEGDKTLKYDIISENATSIDLPNEFGHSTLVIDSAICPPWHCPP